MKKTAITAALLTSVAWPAFADSTINNLSAGIALAGTEKIPMFQTANPAVTTTPSALKTYISTAANIATACSGTDTQVLFVDGSACAGNAAMLFAKATGTLTTTALVAATVSGGTTSNGVDVTASGVARNHVNGSLTLAAGTAAGNSFSLNTGNAARMSITDAAVALSVNMTFSSDNANDIGASGATRPRNVYAGTNVLSPVHSVTGTAPTITGTCAAPTMAGGNTAGTMTTGTGCSGTTIILTFAFTAPTGWACTTTNRTLSTRVMPQTGSSTTTATFTGTTTNADVLQYSCLAY